MDALFLFYFFIARFLLLPPLLPLFVSFFICCHKAMHWNWKTKSYRYANNDDKVVGVFFIFLCEFWLFCWMKLALGKKRCVMKEHTKIEKSIKFPFYDIALRWLLYKYVRRLTQNINIFVWFVTHEVGLAYILTLLSTEKKQPTVQFPFPFADISIDLVEFRIECEIRMRDKKKVHVTCVCARA